jgi:hypothetical protein
MTNEDIREAFAQFVEAAVEEKVERERARATRSPEHAIERRRGSRRGCSVPMR